MNLKLLFTLLAFIFTSSIAISQNYYLGTENGGGSLTCSTCHTASYSSVAPPVYDTWKYTAHARAQDSLSSSHYGYSCLQCHNTGWDTSKANYGADDFVKYDSTKTPDYVITNQAGWDKVKNVGCEACHGPLGTKDGLLSNDHWTQKLDYSSAVCGKCHQGVMNPFIEEWDQSIHAQSTSGPEAGFITGNKKCVRCHVAQNFILYSQNPAAYKDTILATGSDIQPITCAACHNPHEKKYTAQLRFPITETKVICDECHASGIDSVNINTTPHQTTSYALSGSKLFGYQYPGQTYQNSAHTYAATERCLNCHMNMSADKNGNPNKGHTFDPRIQACEQCHSDYYATVDTSNPAKRFDYRGVQTTTDSLMNVLSAKLTSASSYDSTTDSFKEANYNLLSVQADGSHGIHNTKLIEKLLRDAIAGFSPTTGVETGIGTPGSYSLSQNYPNPFNPVTTIKFSIPKGSNVKIIIYDAIGKETATLVNSYFAKGNYKVEWNASSYSSGVYFYRIEAKNFSMVKKMILMK